MKIRVPATSANLGPGFDSCGIAVTKYLVIEVLEATKTWQIDHQLGEEIPSDETNLLLQTALRVFPELAPRRLRMMSDIPLTRGLGSSSSVIVAGIELANRLGGLSLSDDEKLKIATEIEGHPDNVAPAILGDFVAAASYEDAGRRELAYINHYFPVCDILAFIPTQPLATEESRSVLPKTLSYKEAVEASAFGNVMTAAIMSGNLAVAGEMMQKDRWHEKYRAKLVPHLLAIRKICKREGGYGCFLSGAGPTVLVLSPAEKTPAIRRCLRQLDVQGEIELLQIDREGVQVF